MPQNYNDHVPNPLDTRIMKTPSAVARRAFFYLQACGHLKAGDSHHTSRQNLQSFLFAVVLDGKGSLKIQKTVTENGSSTLSAAAKAKLAGDYTFIVYTDENCTTPLQKDSTDVTVTLTIPAFAGYQSGDGDRRSRQDR